MRATHCNVSFERRCALFGLIYFGENEYKPRKIRTFGIMPMVSAEGQSPHKSFEVLLFAIGLGLYAIRVCLCVCVCARSPAFLLCRVSTHFSCCHSVCVRVWAGAKLKILSQNRRRVAHKTIDKHFSVISFIRFYICFSSVLLLTFCFSPCTLRHRSVVSRVFVVVQCVRVYFRCMCLRSRCCCGGGWCCWFIIFYFYFFFFFSHLIAQAHN